MRVKNVLYTQIYNEIRLDGNDEMTNDDSVHLTIDRGSGTALRIIQAEFLRSMEIVNGKASQTRHMHEKLKCSPKKRKKLVLYYIYILKDSMMFFFLKRNV